MSLHTAKYNCRTNNSGPKSDIITLDGSIQVVPSRHKLPCILSLWQHCENSGSFSQSAAPGKAWQETEESLRVASPMDDITLFLEACRGFFGREGVSFVEGKVWNRFRRTGKQRVGASCLGNEKHLSKNRADKIPTFCWRTVPKESFCKAKLLLWEESRPRMSSCPEDPLLSPCQNGIESSDCSFVFMQSDHMAHVQRELNCHEQKEGRLMILGIKIGKGKKIIASQQLETLQSSSPITNFQ